MPSPETSRFPHVNYGLNAAASYDLEDSPAAHVSRLLKKIGKQSEGSGRKFSLHHLFRVLERSVFRGLWRS